MSALPTCSKTACRRTGLAMGSPWEIIAHGPPEASRRAVAAAFAEIARLEACLTRYRPESGISKINDAPAGEIHVGTELARLIATALAYSDETGGAFDPTAGILKDLWGFGPSGGESDGPDAKAIRRTRSAVGVHLISVDADRGIVTKHCSDVRLDLGGVGKGLGVDAAFLVMKKAGIARGWISCGSTTYAWDHDSSRGWPVGIRHPQSPDRVVETIWLRDLALATSGSDQQSCEVGGRRVCHLADPKTGEPVSWPGGVSVISSSAARADAFSTACWIRAARSDGEDLFEYQEAETLVLTPRLGRLRRRASSGWPQASFGCEAGAKPISRRHFLGMAAGLAAVVLLPRLAWPVAVYMTEEEAALLVLPNAASFELKTLSLNVEQAERVYRKLGKKPAASTVSYYAVFDSERRCLGAAFPVDVIGKERPISFMIGVGIGGAIEGIEVMVYRESEGSAIRAARFRSQFKGKLIGDSLKVGRDIQNISGATLSSRATSHAAKTALSLYQVAVQAELAR